MHDTHVVVEYPEFDEEENEDVYPIVKNNGKDVVRCRPAPPASARTDWALNDHVRAPPTPAHCICTACVFSGLRSRRATVVSLSRTTVSPPRSALGTRIALGAQSCLYPGPKSASTTEKLWRGAATSRLRESRKLSSVFMGRVSREPLKPTQRRPLPAGGVSVRGRVLGRHGGARVQGRVAHGAVPRPTGG